jgi:hypothetical protein
MGDIAHEKQECMAEAALFQCQTLRLFLIERCESACLTPEQSTAIVKCIDDLHQQSLLFFWILGLRPDATLRQPGKSE